MSNIIARVKINDLFRFNTSNGLSTDVTSKLPITLPMLSLISWLFCEIFLICSSVFYMFVMLHNIVNNNHKI